MRRLALMALVGCAPTQPWLINRDCTPPYDIPPFKLYKCTDASLDHQACLYVYNEQGIFCVEQLERHVCTGSWEEAAHSCNIHSPDEPEDWQLPPR